MEIRTGEIQDINVIMDIVKNAIIHMEARGIYQWDSIYPNHQVIEEDIFAEKLYVYVDQHLIKGIIVLNDEEDKEYEKINWKYNLGKHLVIHRLCVEPKYQGMGIARTLISYAEKQAMEAGYESIRLDAYIGNNRSCAMYEKAGYQKMGMVSFRKGDFCCFEKGLNKYV